MKIAVTSGYSKSRHAIALIAMLAKRGHDVGLCLNVRTLSVKRFRAYYRFYGRKLFSLARRRMMSGGSADALHPEVRYMDAYLKENGIQARTIGAVSRETGTRVVSVGSLNDEKSLAAVRSYGPDVIVYAGGGLLRAPLIALPGIGVLNAHGGPLPAVRGMNAAEWALMLGLRPGTHEHFIDTGVDTGPLLFFQPLAIGAGDVIADVRGKATVQAVESHLRAVDLLAEGRRELTAQDRSAGQQYFDMHPLLVDILDDWLRNGRLNLAPESGSRPT
ncbi:MAG TPA: formyltransferase family protein [Phycisphaerae bacterium]|nr:formyltransferase family protein [Phycisphaerae bacterium]HRW53226.1 formyltransferase family protein [Phycisphaerae bacterium]